MDSAAAPSGSPFRFIVLVVVTTWVAYLVAGAAIGILVTVSMRLVDGAPAVNEVAVLWWSIGLCLGGILALMLLSAVDRSPRVGFRGAVSMVRRLFVAIQPVPTAPRAVPVVPQLPKDGTAIRVPGLGLRAALHFAGIGSLGLLVALLIAGLGLSVALDDAVPLAGRLLLGAYALGAIVIGLALVALIARTPWYAVTLDSHRLSVRSYVTTRHFDRSELVGAEPALIDRGGGPGLWAMGLGRTDDRWMVRLRRRDGSTIDLPVTLSTRRTLEPRLRELNAWIGVVVAFESMWDLFDPDDPDLLG